MSVDPVNGLSELGWLEPIAHRLEEIAAYLHDGLLDTDGVGVLSGVVNGEWALLARLVRAVESIAVESIAERKGNATTAASIPDPRMAEVEGHRRLNPSRKRANEAVGKRANEAVGVESQRFNNMALDGKLIPADRDSAVWFLIGQFKTSMEKVLAAVEEDRDELSEVLSTAIEGEMATVVRLRTILGDIDLAHHDFDAAEEGVVKIGKCLERFHTYCAEEFEEEEHADHS